MQLQTSLCDEVPWLWKADVDAAFRRVPLCEAHKWAAGVAYLYKGEPWVATHLGMPFGATSSVVAWHRIGELITALARKLLHLPVFRYVDDWFGADKPGCAEHAMGCMARLVRALLGESSVADRMLEFGSALTVLGIRVSPSSDGARFEVDADKAQKWLCTIDAAIETLHLDAGAAQKLAGRLSWATQLLFRKLGRAMIKPIFAQCASCQGWVGSRLLATLKRWKHILHLGVSENRPWKEEAEGLCFLFVDAAGTPPHTALPCLSWTRACFTRMSL